MRKPRVSCDESVVDFWEDAIPVDPMEDAIPVGDDAVPVMYEYDLVDADKETTRCVLGGPIWQW